MLIIYIYIHIYKYICVCIHIWLAECSSAYPWYGGWTSHSRACFVVEVGRYLEDMAWFTTHGSKEASISSLSQVHQAWGSWKLNLNPRIYSATENKLIITRLNNKAVLDEHPKIMVCAILRKSIKIEKIQSCWYPECLEIHQTPIQEVRSLHD